MLWFETMYDCKSPKVPFTIFKTRFHYTLDDIIFDNACNLHKNCLSREPNYLKKKKDSLWTGFNGNVILVMLVHKDAWRDMQHIYISTQTINSQINEQTNAGL